MLFYIIYHVNNFFVIFLLILYFLYFLYTYTFYSSGSLECG